MCRISQRCKSPTDCYSYQFCHNKGVMCAVGARSYLPRSGAAARARCVPPLASPLAPFPPAPLPARAGAETRPP
eukprot:4075966-Pyramimonas_sp.AAC.1